MRVISRLLVVLLFIVILGPSLFAQDNPNLQNGMVPFGSYNGGDLDSVNLYNGNLVIHIPLFNYPQRGSLPGQYKLLSNSKNFYVVQSCNTKLETCTLRWDSNEQYGPAITQVTDFLHLQIPWRSTTSNGLHVVSWDGSSHEMWGGQSMDATGIHMNRAGGPHDPLANLKSRVDRTSKLSPTHKSKQHGGCPRFVV